MVSLQEKREAFLKSDVRLHNSETGEIQRKIDIGISGLEDYHKKISLAFEIFKNKNINHEKAYSVFKNCEEYFFKVKRKEENFHKATRDAQSNEFKTRSKSKGSDDETENKEDFNGTEEDLLASWDDKMKDVDEDLKQIYEGLQFVLRRLDNVENVF